MIEYCQNVYDFENLAPSLVAKNIYDRFERAQNIRASAPGGLCRSQIYSC